MALNGALFWSCCSPGDHNTLREHWDGPLSAAANQVAPFLAPSPCAVL